MEYLHSEWTLDTNLSVNPNMKNTSFPIGNKQKEDSEVTYGIDIFH